MNRLVVLCLLGCLVAVAYSTPVPEEEEEELALVRKTRSPTGGSTKPDRRQEGHSRQLCNRCGNYGGCNCVQCNCDECNCGRGYYGGGDCCRGYFGGQGYGGKGGGNRKGERGKKIQ